jgi:hypothetical protein
MSIECPEQWDDPSIEDASLVRTPQDISGYMYMYLRTPQDTSGYLRIPQDTH